VVQLQFLGSGDAFGSGGRFQTCLMLSGSAGPVLIDCGATSLVAMKRAGVNPSEVGAVLISHLHGDHFGGIPFLVLDGQFNRRELPLLIAGPPGVQERVERAMEVLFPGSSTVERRFPTRYLEWRAGIAATAGPCTVAPYTVDHPSGAPAFALRVTYDGRTVSYSGDTAWTDSLLDAARGADLFVAEAYFHDRQVKFHLDYARLARERARLDCRRIILTHMSPDVLTQDSLDFERAEDGLIVAL